jgi:hypothetical protein
LEISENLTKLADELQRASADSPSRSSRKHISENGAAQEWYQVEARASAEGKHEAVASAVAAHHQLTMQPQETAEWGEIRDAEVTVSLMRQRRASLKMLAHEAQSYVVSRRRQSLHIMGDLAMAVHDEEQGEGGEAAGDGGEEKDLKDQLMDELGLLPGDLRSPAEESARRMAEELEVVEAPDGAAAASSNDTAEPTESIEEFEQNMAAASESDSVTANLNDSLDTFSRNTPSYLTHREPPKGLQDMGGYTIAVYTDEQQARLGVDEQGEVNQGSAAAEAPATTQVLPPAWVTSGLEAPAGEKSMGSYTIAVFTEEQQVRLGVNAEGVKQGYREAATVEAAPIVRASLPAPAAAPVPTPVAAPVEERLTPADRATIESLNTSAAIVGGDDASAETSKKLQLLAARSKSRQEQLAKRRADRKAAAATSASTASPRVSATSKRVSAARGKAGGNKPASPYAAPPRALGREKPGSAKKPGAKKTKGPPARLIARLSRKTSVPKGASAYGALPESGKLPQPTGSLGKRGPRKKKAPTQDEILRQKRKAAKERREKMKEEDKVGLS